MAGVRITIHGDGGKSKARNAKLRAAIAAEFDRIEEAKKPKPQKPAKKKFAHIRDYREAGQ